MTNAEVARCLAGNATAYAESGDLETVKYNLCLIRDLLETPEQESIYYDWDDFK